MSEAPTWKDQLGDRIPEDFGREIDIFETEIELRKQDKIDEVLFAETRLRRGVYGQRYDNGQRFDGRQTQQLDYPEQKTKGPNTAWHAPGMVRIKVPFGGLDTTQMETLADLAEEYSDEILHVTTRQDIQLHYVHIEDTIDLQRRLAAVGITSLYGLVDRDVDEVWQTLKQAKAPGPIPTRAQVKVWLRRLPTKR